MASPLRPLFFRSLKAFPSTALIPRTTNKIPSNIRLSSSTNPNMSKEPPPPVYFDITIGNQPARRMEFELYDSITPKTCENFRQLCLAPEKQGYLKSKFHRVITKFMAQGGDFTKGDGTGGKSIYGAKFEDENFIKKHTKRGLLSMANAGPNTNGSQFFITFCPTPHLDGKHVVFGEVTSDNDVLKALEENASGTGKPKQSIEITACGVIS